MRLDRPPLLERLEPCRRVLLVGAGGGYDIFAGLPLYFHLRARGAEVFLANLSFSRPSLASGPRLVPGLVEVWPDAGGREDYFPERWLSQWFEKQGDKVPIYCFEPGGAVQLLAVYQALADHLELDALVLIDGGTDSLMRGDEPGLGTPGEDVASLAAAHLLKLPVRLLVCLGFGIDAHHRVCHAHVLEAVAELSAQDHFLGAFSLLPGMPEFQSFAEAVEYVSGQTRSSIVADSVIAATRGHFGDHHSSERTRGSRLFINPLMALYWSFELDGVARRCLYLDRILPTRTRGEVTQAISKFRGSIQPRLWQELPL